MTASYDRAGIVDECRKDSLSNIWYWEDCALVWKNLIPLTSYHAQINQLQAAEKPKKEKQILWCLEFNIGD